MKRTAFLFLVFLLFYSYVQSQNKEPIRIACIGNSITYGAGIQNRFQNSYPGILQQLLGKEYDVRNFGLSGTTMLRKGDFPYMNESPYRDAQAFLPNIVTIKLGTNDSKPQNWRFKEDFEKDLTEMIETFQALPTHPTVYLCLPVPCYQTRWGINDSTILRGVTPLIRKVAKKKGLRLIDLRPPLSGGAQLFSDYVHPNEQGATLIAQTIYQTLTGREAPAYSPEASFAGKQSTWKGFPRYDFTCMGRDAIVVAPRKAATGRPWIWRPAFFDAFASVDSALLEKGFHVAYYDLTHLYGSPRAVSLGNEFYNVMTKSYRLSPKVTLEGFSRGGYFAFNWAARNAGRVACIYVDAPVCDITSWPGRKQASLWSDFLKEWNLEDRQVDDQFQGNAMFKLDELLKARVPIIAVCGDSDTDVPYTDNMKKVRDRYQAMGGVVEVILKPGCAHHPHSLQNPEPIVDFILRYQPANEGKQHIHQRGTLNNAFIRFMKEKQGCVAFLGGSITEMKGWHNQVEESLKQRFPDTKFSFTEAGISSTGSTPHAFRFQQDVLDKGIPDLLFIEAAVNDDTNGFSPVEQVRGMEGIVRQALAANPKMNIVMLHFIYDPFIPLLQNGRQPDVILNHERVANAYMLPSINLAQEVAERMMSGEFTWEQFGGTHPSWEGHKYYTATINRLFDQMIRPIDSMQESSPLLAAKPLDTYSYDQGRLVNIREARLSKGFTYVDSWTPSDKAHTRNGFVNVPMLEAKQKGATLKLNFTGRAVGIFCVAGPRAAVLEYSIDGTPYKELKTMTEWSKSLYLPWVYLFASELTDAPHVLTVRVKEGECQIRNFLVNR